MPDVPQINGDNGPNNHLNGENGGHTPVTRKARYGWRLFFTFLFAGLVFLVLFALLPAFESPRSRVYASLVGMPSVSRFLGEPIKVEARRAERRSLARTLMAEGTVGYLNETPVRSEVLGIVTALCVERGQMVRKGEVLMRINTGEFNIQIAQLLVRQRELEYRQAQVDLARSEGLVRTKAVSPHACEMARVQVQKAKTALAEAREQLTYTMLSRSMVIDRKRNRAQKKDAEGGAPGKGEVGTREVKIQASVSGTVFQRLVEPGENIIEPRNPLLYIGDRLVFQANFDQRYASSIHLGDKGFFALKAYPGIKFEGKVVRIGALVQPEVVKTTGAGGEYPNTFPVWLVLSGNQITGGEKLVKGMNGYCTMQRRFSALAIPESALMRYSGRSGAVLVVDASNHLQFKPVVYTAADGGWVAIESGLQEGERVVLEGQVALEPGDEVTVNDNDRPS